ncbi:ENTH-domain-containing protein [Leucogyrophana mollusca]|uniref:ENTH-domain-containing protein n=1 Tax=Leucogyrophana mollusca TaxID=85980 RepID=A0ACB8BTE5_9AGAM|nr:ENTH-domain-containing protein [Leucogyrophana mollusca]
MDRFDSLASTLSNLTVYDLKSMYNQAKNVVLNVSEMEAKVREATNDEPWGASSTLMQEIAQGTFNFQYFNEIMPCIYARFMEKEARQWRQIYKALQLLEYLVKHGSERVVDDARSHVSTLKMLRNFHYIDDKGKDEGLNVRNRARELVEMLSDVEAIRNERRKAKANRHKYTGTGNDPMSFSSGGSRYGGFGSDSLGGGGGYYGDRMSGSNGGGYDRDYGGSSGGGSSGFRDSTSRTTFEEYTAGDDDTVVRRSTSVSRGNAPSRSSTSVGSPLRTSQTTTAPPPPKAKEPEVDLLGGFGDDDEPLASSVGTNTNKALPTVNTATEDDEFADFQAAPASPPPASARPTLMEMLSSSPPAARRAPVMSPPLASQAPAKATSPVSPPAYTSATFGMLSPTSNRQSFSSSPAVPMQNTMFPTSQPLSPTTSVRTASPAAATPAATKPASKPASNFEDLWSMSLGAPVSSGGNRSATTGKSIKDLEKEKAQAGIWASTQKPGGSAMGMGGGFGNFGGLGSAKGTSSTSAGGGDDLLL